MSMACLVCGASVEETLGALCPDCGVAPSQLTERQLREAEALEARIEGEIVKRSEAYDAATRASEEAVLDARAAVEAVEDLIDIPDEEAQRIADAVRAEHLEAFKRAQQLRRGLRVGLPIAVAVVALLAAWFLYAQARYEGVTYRAVFTSGVTDSAPTDQLERAPIDGERIYLWVSWSGLPDGGHDYRIRVTDGAGTVVWDSPWSFESQGTKTTWSHYKPKPGLDAPGLWRFEIFLGGTKILEERLPVEASP